MIPGGRMNPRQLKRMMKQLGIEAEELGDVREVVIRTGEKEYVIKGATVTAMTVQGQTTYQVVGEPTVREVSEGEEPGGPVIPQEDVELVAEKAGVSEEEARRALEECDGEPAEAIITLMSK